MDYDGANPAMLTDGSALVLGPSLANVGAPDPVHQLRDRPAGRST